MATWKWYGNAISNQWGTTAGNRVNFSGDTIKCALTTSTYSPNQDTHDFFDDVTNEVTGTLYTAGGVTLSGKSVTYDGASNETRFLWADPTWGPGATISNAAVAVVYKDTGTASTSPLIGYLVFDGPAGVANGTLVVDVDATAVLKITAA